MTLPKWLTDLLVFGLLPLAKLIGRNGLIELFKSMSVKSPNYYRSVIIVGYRALVVHIKPLAEKTETPWDNEAVDLVISAMQQSATDNSVPLPDVTIMAEETPVIEQPPV